MGALLLGLVIGLPASTTLVSAAPVIDGDLPNLINQGDEITFSGHDDELEEDEIAAYEWSSSLDSFIGDARTLTTNSLSPGDHSLAFKVQDTNGTWSEPAETQLVVNGRPNATIVMPETSNITQGDHSSFRAISYDIDGDVTAYDWDSSIDGNVGNSNTLDVALLSAGDHVLSLTVADDLKAWSKTVQTDLHINARPVVILSGLSLDAYYDRYDSDSNNDGSLTTLNFDIVADDSRQPASTNASSGSTVPVNSSSKATYFKLANKQPIQLREAETFVVQAEAEDIDGQVDAYRWASDLDGIIGREPELVAESLSPGEHVITFQVRDDEGAWSHPARLELTVIPYADHSNSGGTRIVPVVDERKLYSGILIYLVIVLSTTYVYTDETYRYKLSNTLVPLTTSRRKRRGEDPLAHETRSMIKGALLMQPGAHYSMLKEKLKLNNGTLAHHLRVMEKEELVVSQRMGHLRCFFLAGQRNGSDRQQLPLTAIQEQAIEQVSTQPGITQRRLAVALSITPAAVKYQADKLIAKGLISRRREGLAVRYDVVDPQLEPNLEDLFQFGLGCGDL